MEIVCDVSFLKEIKKSDSFLLIKIKKQIKKIINDPFVGKHLFYTMGERTIYVRPFRIIYSYDERNDVLYFLKFEHRDSVYR